MAGKESGGYWRVGIALMGARAGFVRTYLLRGLQLGLSIGFLLFHGVAGAEAAATVAPAPSPGPVGLPDGRGYEQVSPADKNGNEAGASSLRLYFALASANGRNVMYGGSGPFGDTQSGSDNLSVSSRSETGEWQTRAVLPAGQGIDSNNIVAEKPVGTLPSADFSKFAFYATGSFQAENPPTGAGTESQALYIAHSTPPPSEWDVTWLTRPSAEINPIPAPGGISQTFIFTIDGRSPDLSTVYFSYYGTLVPEDAARTPNVNANNIFGPWGFYEWDEGRLVSAAGLPNGKYDPYGAMAAGAYGKNSGGGVDVVSDAFHNQVSQNGTRAIFVSPDPETEHPENDPIELYLHKQGQPRGILISRDEFNGGAPAAGYAGLAGSTGVTPTITPTPAPENRIKSYMYASPDGSRVLFESMDKLANDSGGAEPSGGGPWTYDFNVATEKLVYLPGVIGSILASSTDGTTFMFEHPGTPGSLNVWSNGTIKVIGEFSNLSEPGVAPTRSTDSGSVFVWETNAALDPGSFNNGGGFDQVYRYDAGNNTVSCLSCPPAGISPTGDARLANDDKQSGIREVSGSAAEIDGSRGISSDGARVFFETPDPLVLQDVNGKRDVYEWENGRLYLISSGQGGKDSVFLDNSASGNDVFFASADSLLEGDYDGVYDVYDARVDGGAPTRTVSPSPCRSDCQGLISPAPEFETPLSTAFVGAGNPGIPKAATTSVKKTKKSKKKAKHKVKRRVMKHAAKAKRSSKHMPNSGERR